MSFVANTEHRRVKHEGSYSGSLADESPAEQMAPLRAGVCSSLGPVENVPDRRAGRKVQIRDLRRRRAEDPGRIIRASGGISQVAELLVDVQRPPSRPTRQAPTIMLTALLLPPASRRFKDTSRRWRR